ncbi:10976_t:CDS:2 [Gigaspora rosea]|nr:10976_t:CDS:2 [Gigaspora rosea]
MNKWYYKLVSEEYRKVLDLHKVLTPVITRVNNENPNANELAGYYAYLPSKKMK